MLGRNLLVDLDRSMQGASEWRIFHDGNRMFVGDLPDLESQGVNALGYTHGGIHSPLIFECYGKMGRVGDNDGGFWDCRNHSAAHAELLRVLLVAVAEPPAALLPAVFWALYSVAKLCDGNVVESETDRHRIRFGGLDFFNVTWWGG